MKSKTLNVILFSLFVEVIIITPLLISVIFYENWLKNTFPDRNIFFAITLLVFFFLILVAVVIKKDKFRLFLKRNKKDIYYAIISILVLAVIGIFIILITKIKMYQISDINVWIVSPIGEELVFRLVVFYFIYRHIEKVGIKCVAVLTIIITSVLFGLLHLFNIFVTNNSNVYFILGQTAFATIMGLYLGYMRYKTNSLIIPIIAHMIINFLPVINYF